MDDDPEAALAAKAGALADALDRTVERWLADAVETRAAAAGRTGPEVEEAAAEAARTAAAAVLPRLRDLLATDVDAQTTNPLALLREAVGPATAALASLGVPPVERDDFAVGTFPDDVYDLAPAAFADLGPDLRQPGLEWGAAKAFVHLRRRRAEGREP